MVKRIALVAALVAAGIVAWALMREPPKPPERPAVAKKSGTDEDAPPSAKRASNPEPSQPEAPPPVKTMRKVDKAEREAYRREIAERLAERARKHTAPPESNNAADDEDEPTPEPGEIRDRTGGKLTKFVGTINEDFMPLADECYQQALEEQPDLAGMLDMNVSVIADEEIGGLVESVELGKENEIHHAGMTECIRESMLSTIFPSLDESGSTGVRMTLRFAPDEE